MTVEELIQQLEAFEKDQPIVFDDEVALYEPQILVGEEDEPLFLIAGEPR